MSDERALHLWFLESLDRINRAIQGSNDFEQATGDLLEAVLSILGCDRAWLLYPCDPDAPSWRPVMEHTRPEFPGAFALGRDMPMDPQTAEVFRTARSSGQAVRRGPPPSLPVPAEYAEPFRIRSLIAVAVHPRRERPYLFGLHQCTYARIWTAAEERLLQEIGRRLGDALTGLLTWRDLRESERRLAEAQRLAHVGYWDREVDTGRVTLSEETRRIFALPPESEHLQLERWHEQWVDLIHPEDRPRVTAAAEAATQAGADYDVEYRILWPRGEVRHVHSRGSVTRDETGRVRRLFGMMQDITELRRAERELRESEARFRTFVDHATDAFFLQDDGRVVIDANRQACQSLGYSREELIGLHPRDFDAGLDEAELARVGDRVGAGETLTFESLHRRKDGTVFPVEVRAARFRQGDRWLRLSLARDITERRRAEERLIEAKERFRTLAESSLIGVYLVQDGVFQYVNPVMARMFGYTVEELLQRLGPVDLAHPDDRTILESVEGESEEIRYEMRAVRKDGSVFPIEVHARRIELGGKVGVMGALLDNTERKHAEQELRTSEARFRALIEHAGDAFMLHDERGRVVEANRTACESLGYTREEVLGKTPMDFAVGFSEEDLVRLQPQVSAGETFSFETFHRRKDGSLFPVEVRVRSAGLGSGYAIALWRDITDRRRNERRTLARQKITQALAEARTLEEAAPRVLAAVGEGLDWDLAELWRVGPERNGLRVVDTWHREGLAAARFEAGSRESLFAPGHGLPGQAWSAARPIWITDVVQDPSFLRGPLAAAAGLHAGLGFPILLGGEVLGVFDLFSTEIRNPDPDLLETLGGITSQIGQFIERKKAEDALNDARAQLAHLTRVMTMGELTAAIAHELKQPLTSLAAAAGASRRWLARDPPALDEVRECLVQISGDARRAAEVLDGIRSMIEKAPPSKMRLDLNQTIREVLALAHGEVLRHQILVRTVLSPDLPAVLGDRVQLQQVVLNLVVNGIHAMTSITHRPRELWMRTSQVGGEVLVTVEDRGVGVKPEALERIFDAFFTTKSEGLGVGLAISRRIIDSHGGRLWASSNNGVGTTFQFTLPAEPTTDEPAESGRRSETSGTLG